MLDNNEAATFFQLHKSERIALTSFVTDAQTDRLTHRWLPNIYLYNPILFLPFQNNPTASCWETADTHVRSI